MLFLLETTVAGLEFSSHIPSAASHEIDGVARGLGVYQEGRCIVGEGIGIGAPLALLNGRAIFPLDVENFQSGDRLTRRFHLNGLSKKYVGKAPADVPYKWIRSQLAPLYLKSSRFRPFFKYLMTVRSLIGIKSQYRKIRSIGYVDIAYEHGSHEVRVQVDASRLAANKFLVANELNGQLFNRLTINNYVNLTKIPPWLEIGGSEVRLTAPSLRLSFCLRRVEGCKMFAGREVLGKRLNWAGVSYLASPGMSRFGYEVVFKKND